MAPPRSWRSRRSACWPGIAVTRDRGLLLLATVMLTGTALHAVLVSHPRYALPLVPLLVAGGVAGPVLIRQRGPAAARERSVVGRALAPAPDGVREARAAGTPRGVSS